MNLASLLHTAARRVPEATAVAVGEQALHSYQSWAGRIVAIAAHMRHALGLVPGDRVALAMSNCPAFYEVLFAAWHAGLAAVPINAKLHPQEFRYILAHSGSRACFCTPELYAALDALRAELPELTTLVDVATDAYERSAGAGEIDLAEVRADAPAWLFYTSGTTGRPKGAILTHRNLLYMMLAYYADIDRLSERDTILHAAPMSHGSGLYGLAHIAQGGCNVIPRSGHFDPEEIFALLRRWQQVSMFAAPTMLGRLLRCPGAAGADTRGLKTIVYGGAPMYLSDLEAAIELFGPRLYNLYGQGESPMTITGLSKAAHAESDHPRYRERLCSCGVARTGVEVRVVDDDDRVLPAGAIGEVITRSDCVMAGYWNAPEASASALRGGWLHTGDLGTLDAEGYLTLKDRSKDMIISGGSNIYPREIEEVLLRHPGVVEVSVVGRAHPDWGEEVVAFVVPDPAQRPSETELDRLCLQHIARFKRPRAYRFIERLPKNNYGKVLKTELRALLAPAASD